MPFPPTVKEDALVRSRRCCCVCHEFAGVYSNVHHIEPQASGGPDTLDNAIVLCLRCHGEAGHYNPKHPIGNKYSPIELRRHRDNWWTWCRDNPTAPLPKEPISVTPGQGDLGRGEWRASFLVKLCNRSDSPMFQVFVKLRIRSPDIPLDAVEIVAQGTRPRLEFQVGGVILSADTYQILGTDESGHKTIYLWIHYLDPKETYTFLVRNRSPVAASEFERHICEVSLAAFEREPPQLLEERGGVAMPFRLPENFCMRGMALVLRRAPTEAGV